MTFYVHKTRKRWPHQHEETHSFDTWQEAYDYMMAQYARWNGFIFDFHMSPSPDPNA